MNLIIDLIIIIKKYIFKRLCWLKALAVRTLMLSGCFIIGYDNDDCYNTCNCGVFPATNVIHDGIYGKEINENLTTCTKFGMSPHD